MAPMSFLLYKESFKGNSLPTVAWHACGEDCAPKPGCFSKSLQTILRLRSSRKHPQNHGQENTPLTLPRQLHQAQTANPTSLASGSPESSTKMFHIVGSNWNKRVHFCGFQLCFFQTKIRLRDGTWSNNFPFFLGELPIYKLPTIFYLCSKTWGCFFSGLVDHLPHFRLREESEDGARRPPEVGQHADEAWRSRGEPNGENPGLGWVGLVGRVGWFEWVRWFGLR